MLKRFGLAVMMVFSFLALSVANDADFHRTNIATMTSLTNQWSACPSTNATYGGRTGLLFDVPPANILTVFVAFTSGPWIPSISTANGVAYRPSDAPVIFSASKNLYLWASSSATTPSEQYFCEELLPK